jgi:hypothetical protein
VNSEVAYRVLEEPRAHVRLQYEVFDYRERRPEYSSPQGYQIIRPVFDLKPKITPWLWLDLKVEFPYVIDDSSWGTGITVGPQIKVGENFELTAAYFRYDIPGEFTTYAGEGFKVGLVWRF